MEGILDDRACRLSRRAYEKFAFFNQYLTRYGHCNLLYCGMFLKPENININCISITLTYVNAHKYFFSNRICDAWNALPNTVVEAAYRNSFKRLLDSVDLCQLALFFLYIGTGHTGLLTCKWPC